MFEIKEENKTGEACSATQFSVAPMLDWTDRHCRYFHRKLSKHAWLYSEMVTTGAMIYGDNLERFIGFNEQELPVVLQLGGAKADELEKCAKIGQEWGYSEINLNVGCPSDRVQNNMIGACLMGHPQIVAEDVAAMKAAVDIPVTVKCRIGIDDQESYETLYQFIDGIAQAGVDGVIIHARKAWLQGLSPKENREIPPLNYGWVHQLKVEFPNLPIAVNGGITTLTQGLKHMSDNGWSNEDGHTLPPVDGVMMGRAIYEQPYLLSEVDRLFYDDKHPVLDRFAVVQEMLPYIDAHLSKGGKLIHITRHMLGLFHGLPGGRMWRRYLSQNAHKHTAGIEVVEEAMQMVKTEQNRMAEQQRLSEAFHANQAKGCEVGEAK